MRRFKQRKNKYFHSSFDSLLCIDQTKMKKKIHIYSKTYARNKNNAIETTMMRWSSETEKFLFEPRSNPYVHPYMYKMCAQKDDAFADCSSFDWKLRILLYVRRCIVFSHSDEEPKRERERYRDRATQMKNYIICVCIVLFVSSKRWTKKKEIQKNERKAWKWNVHFHFILFLVFRTNKFFEMSIVLFSILQMKLSQRVSPFIQTIHLSLSLFCFRTFFFSILSLYLHFLVHCVCVFVWFHKGCSSFYHSLYSIQQIKL